MKRELIKAAYYIKRAAKEYYLKKVAAAKIVEQLAILKELKGKI